MRIVFFLMIFFIIQVNVFGEEKVKICTFPIPGIVIDKDHGVFIDFLKELDKRTPFDIEIVTLPRKRGLMLFNSGSMDIFFPASDVDFPDNPKLKKVEVTPVTKRDYVFTRKGESFLKTIKDLEGKVVGITLGASLGKEISENSLIILENAPGDTNNTLKLMSGRIDAFVCEQRTGINAFRDEGVLDKVQYDLSTPVSEMKAYFAIKNDDKGLKWAEIISKVLDEMETDGTFGTIFKE